MDRLRRIRRDAAVAGYDVTLVNANMVGWFHTSNPYLRYVCDWAREGILIIPTDTDASLQLLSFYTESVLLPPGGEPLLVEDIWQVAPWGRESLDRPGSPLVKAVEGCANLLKKLGFERAQIGLIGDDTSPPYWAGLAQELPKAKFAPATDIILRMQRIRSTGELAIIRSAAQLADIAYQAACHVTRPGVTDYEIYAAFTYAQMARGGETGDGYQIGVNQYGTHCGKPYGHVIRDGDLINLYVSNVSYHGYCAQTARMIAVGTITPQQEEVLQMCVDGVRRAERLIKPGASFDSLHEAAFAAYTERGYLTSTKTRTMPFNWEALPDGTPGLSRGSTFPTRTGRPKDAGSCTSTPRRWDPTTPTSATPSVCPSCPSTTSRPTTRTVWKRGWSSSCTRSGWTRWSPVATSVICTSSPTTVPKTSAATRHSIHSESRPSGHSIGGRLAARAVRPAPAGSSPRPRRCAPRSGPGPGWAAGPGWPTRCPGAPARCGRPRHSG